MAVVSDIKLKVPRALSVGSYKPIAKPSLLGSGAPINELLSES
jgi:hypothetical protein